MYVKFHVVIKGTAGEATYSLGCLMLHVLRLCFLMDNFALRLHSNLYFCFLTCLHLNCTVFMVMGLGVVCMCVCSEYIINCLIY